MMQGGGDILGVHAAGAHHGRGSGAGVHVRRGVTGRRITDERLREAIRAMNEERRLRMEIASFAGRGLTGREAFLALAGQRR